MQTSKEPLIFVVEDNQVYNKLVVSYLKSNKFTNVKDFLSGEECIKHLDEAPDIIIQDYILDGINGIEVLKHAKKKDPRIEFIFLSGQDSIDIAINSMKYGAYDYIVKDQMALKKLVNKINKILTVKKLEKSNKRYRMGVIMFFVALLVVILILMSLNVFFPKTFGF
ncbi:response regulator [Puteibacter caeruleilacunae]|nr:response regulator [Puteibacter caeruleilacunae]